MSKHAKIVSWNPSPSCKQQFTQFKHTSQIQRGQHRVLLQRLAQCAVFLRADKIPFKFTVHRGWMNEQTCKDRELEPITQLQTAVHTVQTYFRDSAWSASCSASET